MSTFTVKQVISPLDAHTTMGVVLNEAVSPKASFVRTGRESTLSTGQLVEKLEGDDAQNQIALSHEILGVITKYTTTSLLSRMVKKDALTTAVLMQLKISFQKLKTKGNQVVFLVDDFYRRGSDNDPDGMKSCFIWRQSRKKELTREQIIEGFQILFQEIPFDGIAINYKNVPHLEDSYFTCKFFTRFNDFVSTLGESTKKSDWLRGKVIYFPMAENLLGEDQELSEKIRGLFRGYFHEDSHLVSQSMMDLEKTMEDLEELDSLLDSIKHEDTFNKILKICDNELLFISREEYSNKYFSLIRSFTTRHEGILKKWIFETLHANDRELIQWLVWHFNDHQEDGGAFISEHPLDISVLKALRYVYLIRILEKLKTVEKPEDMSLDGFSKVLDILRVCMKKDESIEIPFSDIPPGLLVADYSREPLDFTSLLYREISRVKGAIKGPTTPQELKTLLVAQETLLKSEQPPEDEWLV